ncbi:LysR family transcriptional regulator [Bradyrhizobium sp. RP6]|nr:LysR family transcriptional regulator [Bradyrhizobium sp. RP6]
MTAQPPFDALIAFEAVHRLGSVTAAASDLGVTQSAVSHRLRRAGRLYGFATADADFGRHAADARRRGACIRSRRTPHRPRRATRAMPRCGQRWPTTRRRQHGACGLLARRTPADVQGPIDADRTDHRREHGASDSPRSRHHDPLAPRGRGTRDLDAARAVPRAGLPRLPRATIAVRAARQPDAHCRAAADP